VVLTALDDLHLFMGTTAATPFRKGISNSGQLVETLATGGREVGSVTAQSIRASELAFTNRIGSIVVRDKIDTLELTAGQLDSVIVGKSVYRSLWTVAGLVNSIRIGGGWLGTNFLDATGPDGFVNFFATNYSMYGQINAQKGIGTIAVGTDIGSPSIETSGNITSLRVGGSLFDGTFVRSDRSIINLVVDGNIDEGATIVADDIVNQQIAGDVLGTLDLGSHG
jgi:hypothetical protein